MIQFTSMQSIIIHVIHHVIHVANPAVEFWVTVLAHTIMASISHLWAGLPFLRVTDGEQVPKALIGDELLMRED